MVEYSVFLLLFGLLWQELISPVRLVTESFDFDWSQLSGGILSDIIFIFNWLQIGSPLI